MAIVQISKIQQRSGNLVDLPQLDDAEFGWATDSRRLFIGKASPVENIEVLTSYSNVSFSQINGSNYSNLQITGALNGDVLSFDGINWVNKGGTIGGVIKLGDVANLKITGTSGIGYVLQTDGTGNLSWTPKTTVTANITALSNATPVVMTVDSKTPYTNGALVTISGATGTNNTIVNGSSFYIKVATNFPTTGNVSLYTDVGLSVGLVGTGLTYDNSPNAIAVSSISGSGTSAAGGANTSVQFNNNNILNGSANLTFDFANNLLSVNGNTNVTNLNASATVQATSYVSNVTTGTPPLSVVSTTVVPNLYVARANVADYEVVTAQTTGTFYPTFVSGSTTANYTQSSNVNLAFNVATGTLSATSLTGSLTTAAQPNVTSVGTLTALAVTGSISGGNLNTSGLVTASRLISNVATGTAPLTVTSTTQVANLYVALAGSVTTAAQANITSVGTLSSLTVTANISAGNVAGGNLVSATYLEGTLTTSTQPNITSTGTLTALAVTGNISAGNLSATTFTGAFTGTLTGAATTAGTVTTAAQPNITSVGTLTALAVTGNISGANLTGTHYGAATGLTAIPGANVSGIVPSATIAASANAVAGANVSGTVSLAVSATTAGTVTTAAQPNITSVGTLSRVLVGNGTAGAPSIGFASDSAQDTGFFWGGDGYTSITNNGVYTGQFQPGGTLVMVGAVQTPALTTGLNTTAGSITGNWSLTSGSRLAATYADLAEYYAADQSYAPGTVVEFGGEFEVTLASDATARVAGVISTDPAYVMNSGCPGNNVVAVALQGRVPCKVRGTISKGDMLISGGDGYARATSTPLMGTVIGKALQNFTGIDGVIEVAVGRL